MKLKDIASVLEELSPKSYACDWDNVGLMTGDMNKDVKKVLVTLDVDDKAINKAISENCDLIVSHHPFIFSPLKSVTSGSLTGSRILKTIQNDIAVYSMHTNFDIMGGMAELAADKLGMSSPKVLEYTTETQGLGRYDDFDEATIACWADKTISIFGLQGVSVFGDLNSKVSRVAIAPGSGKDSIEYALDNKVQLLITGDIGHHAGIDANACGLAIIDAGHYGIEHIFIEFIAEYLNKQCDELNVIQSELCIPYTYIVK